eukprot:scaffold6683_cov103-Cylindrotheca_fusiformis.AAC.5
MTGRGRHPQNTPCLIITSRQHWHKMMINKMTQQNANCVLDLCVDNRSVYGDNGKNCLMNEIYSVNHFRWGNVVLLTT